MQRSGWRPPETGASAFLGVPRYAAGMRSHKQLLVRMIKDHGIYVAGDNPAFDEHEANRLIQNGIATLIGDVADPSTAAKLEAQPAPTNAPSPINSLGPSGGTHPEAKSTKPPKPGRPSSTRVSAPQMTRAEDEE